MDEELVRRAARGDAEAFDALARDRIDRLFSIAIRILRDHHDAEDAVQQALWTAWSDLPGVLDADQITDRDALEHAFAALSTEQRAVVVLHHYVGLGLDEIASIVGVPAGTARSRLHYALQKLRAALEPVETAAPAVAESGR
jgi:RNA polymerase sigma-70 factor (ECF subfamily)